MMEIEGENFKLAAFKQVNASQMGGYIQVDHATLFCPLHSHLKPTLIRKMLNRFEGSLLGTL